MDGKPSQGTANRIKILEQAGSFRATACRANDLMAMKKENCRALVRDHDVIFIYHNRIDLTGDKRESEEQVFEAVEETLQELIRLIKKLTGANASNLLVTSDHGFIYQHRAIEESDFLSNQPSAISHQLSAGSDGEIAKGACCHYVDRRFIIGKHLSENSSLHRFTAAQLGLVGEVEVQIPKSIRYLMRRSFTSDFDF